MSDDDVLYQTTDEYGDPFEVEWGEAEQRYYVTVHDKVPGKPPTEAVSSLTVEQMRGMVLAVGSHVAARTGAS